MWTSLVILGAALLDGGDAAVPSVVSLPSVGVDPQWLLPQAVIDSDASLAKQLAPLVDVVLEKGQGDGSFAAVSNLGDLVEMFAPLRADSTAFTERLRQLEKERPEIAAKLLPVFSELMRSSALSNPEWSPDDESRDDGFHLGKPMILRDELGPPWTALDDGDVLQQGAVLVLADFATIKAVERDYPSYYRRAGQGYEEIRAIEGSYRNGTAPDVGAFGTHSLYFRCDLPFPFSNYECDLVVVDRLDPRGNPRCDVYSTSSDFHWLAGVDTYLPVRNSQGVLQGWLIVRQFGFDLDDVPDGDSDREAALRSSLCNLKRDAERKRGDSALSKSGDVLPVIQKH